MTSAGRRNWGLVDRYAEHCDRCHYGIKPGMVSRDARIPGVFHPGCLFKQLKDHNPHYRKLA